MSHIERERKARKKEKKSTIVGKIYFGIFVFATILTIFLFWAVRNDEGDVASVNKATTLIAAIISLCLAIFFGCLGFIRFLRGRSIAGGIFLTTALSTATFLGASRLVAAFMPTGGAVAAFASNDPAATGAGFSIVVLLAQLGLFAVWFAFLLFAIKVQVSPIKKVDKYLSQIIAGEEIKHRIRIGKSKQYKELELKLRTLHNIQRESLEKEPPQTLKQEIPD